MKLMDKNGRLFGKISVIDVVVVLVVLVMAAALYVKNTSLSHTSTRVTNTPITYQVTAYNVRQYVADAIQEGDLLLYLDDTRIVSADDLRNAVYEYEVGEAVEAIIYSQGQQYRVELTLGEDVPNYG